MKPTRIVLCILLIVTAFSSTGCTAIGYKIGTRLDERMTKYYEVETRYELSKFKVGSSIKIKTFDGHLLTGTIIDMEYDSYIFMSAQQLIEGNLYNQAKELAELKRQLPAEDVNDYSFVGKGGNQSSLSDLFGDKSDLIIVHNMGKTSPYCTLWADGFNGLTHHFEDRAGFVVVSPDAHDVQSEFAKSRNWSFKMASDGSGDFTRDMGFLNKDNYWLPGYSTFVKKGDGKIQRVGQAFLGPGDLYCSAWHMFDLLEGGVGDWQPKFGYGEG